MNVCQHKTAEGDVIARGKKPCAKVLIGFTANEHAPVEVCPVCDGPDVPNLKGKA